MKLLTAGAVEETSEVLLCQAEIDLSVQGLCRSALNVHIEKPALLFYANMLELPSWNLTPQGTPSA